MRLSEVGRQRRIVVAYDGDEIGVTFRPKAINVDWLDRLGAIDGSGDSVQAYVSLLSEALVSWEIEDEQGQALEPTPELMRQLPVDLLNLISLAMMEGLAPKK